MHTNLASLLTQYQGNRERLLYRQYLNGSGWRDFSAGDMLELAARWQQAYRIVRRYCAQFWKTVPFPP